MLRFSLLGFRISVHWMFWLNTALLGGGLSAESPREMQALVLWVLAAFVSIIIHELGHALLMRHYGARAEIHLYAFGGLAIPDRGFDRVKSILVSLAGPGAQILAGIPAWWLFHHSTGDAWQVLVFLSSFTQVSFAWALLNLAPVYPLDGGHVMGGILGPRRFRTTLWISIITAICIGLYRFSVSNQIYTLILFGMLAWSNVQRLQGTQSSFLRT